MDGVMTRVGLQLLLEPSSTAWIARGACVTAGAVYPAYATYKAVLAPKRALPPNRNAAAVAAGAGLEQERWLKYWAVFGLACLAERLLEHHIDRVFPYYPHAKLAFLLWLQLHNGHGAALLFDGYLVPRLSRYERKLDTLLEAGAQLVELFHSTYAGPISYMQHAVSVALGQLAAFLKWIATPDEPDDGSFQDGSSSSSARRQHPSSSHAVPAGLGGSSSSSGIRRGESCQ